VSNDERVADDDGLRWDVVEKMGGGRLRVAWRKRFHGAMMAGEVANRGMTGIVED
jgi:hypothetical protein